MTIISYFSTLIFQFPNIGQKKNFFGLNCMLTLLLDLTTEKNYQKEYGFLSIDKIISYMNFTAFLHLKKVYSDNTILITCF